MRVPCLPILCAAILITGCSERQRSGASVAEGSGPLVVYTSYEDEAYLPDLFAGFTGDTGVRVSVRYADAETIVDWVIENRGAPPADLLLTSNVHGAWRAAEKGALRPLGSELVANSVPARLRDADDYWTAVTFRKAQIVVRTEKISAGDGARYEDLAKPIFEGQLCLSSSELGINRSVIATLISAHGARSTETVVRGWLANLAAPPFRSEAALMRAIEAGTCDVGIVSSSSLQMHQPPAANRHIAAFTPLPATVNVEAIGVTRHAREPEAARQLIEWMLSPAVQSKHSRQTSTYPVHASADGQQASWSGQPADGNVAIVAIFDEDAAKLAERAGYP